MFVFQFLMVKRRQSFANVEYSMSKLKILHHFFLIIILTHPNFHDTYVYRLSALQLNLKFN